MVPVVVPVVWVFDFILVPLLARRLLRMVLLSMVPVPIVPLFMVPVPVPIVPLFMVPVPMVPLFMVPVLVPGVVVVVVPVLLGVVCAKAAVVAKAKAAARKREVDFMTESVLREC